ncbi:hypothetical protein [Paenibacillus amylolyticus]|uniref:hypothetical protein n=1 Tax=Paenibacillus amylolyticus TaxID=1451 RepID=UPI00286B5D65|nr:hypothetical protein [Paenibacillus amylolyticus]
MGIILIVLYFNQSNTDKLEENSNHYTSFVSSVQTLEQTLTQIDDSKNDDELAVLMFDVYTSIIFVNDRITLLRNNTNSSPQMDTLSNEFLLVRNFYESQVRNHLSTKKELNFEIHTNFEEKIRLFLNDLPKDYESSKDFDQQLKKAMAHIKAIIN